MIRKYSYDVRLGSVSTGVYQMVGRVSPRDVQIVCLYTWTYIMYKTVEQILDNRDVIDTAQHQLVGGVIQNF
jgi:hypothetical protein